MNRRLVLGAAVLVLAAGSTVVLMPAPGATPRDRQVIVVRGERPGLDADAVPAAAPVAHAPASRTDAGPHPADAPAVVRRVSGARPPDADPTCMAPSCMEATGAVVAAGGDAGAMSASASASGPVRTAGSTHVSSSPAGGRGVDAIPVIPSRPRAPSSPG